MKGAGDRLVPLALEEGQACRCHVVLVLSVEIQRLERPLHQGMAVDKRQRKLIGFVRVCYSKPHQRYVCYMKMTQQLRMALELESLKTWLDYMKKVYFLELLHNYTTSSLHGDRQHINRQPK